MASQPSSPVVGTISVSPTRKSSLLVQRHGTVTNRWRYSNLYDSDTDEDEVGDMTLDDLLALPESTGLTPQESKSRQDHENEKGQDDVDDDTTVVSEPVSPGTLTLNHLSQDTDLHYDHADLENDLAEREAALKTPLQPPLPSTEQQSEKLDTSTASNGVSVAPLAKEGRESDPAEAPETTPGKTGPTSQEQSLVKMRRRGFVVEKVDLATGRVLVEYPSLRQAGIALKIVHNKVGVAIKEKKEFPEGYFLRRKEQHKDQKLDQTTSKRRKPTLESVSTGTEVMENRSSETTVVVDVDREKSQVLQRTSDEETESKATQEENCTTEKNNKEGMEPFCDLCNERITFDKAMHHPWCPKHPQHIVSRGHEILERLKHGSMLGCNVCKQEYQRGRTMSREELEKNTIAHSKECFEYRRQLEQRLLKEKQAKEKSATHNVTSQATRSQINCEDSSTEEKTASPNDAMFQTRSGRRVRDMQPIISELLRKPDDDSEASMYVPPSHRRENLSAMGRKDKVINTSGGGQSKPKARLGISRDDFDHDSDESDTEVVEVLWEPAENPWGADDYQEGDVVVVLGTTGGFVHHEALLPSRRFEIDPFTETPAYSSTHYTPKEGFHYLELTRDIPTSLPWGFTVKRHEFGGACLVESVQSLSPASSAVSFNCNCCMPFSSVDLIIGLLSSRSALLLLHRRRI